MTARDTERRSAKTATMRQLRQQKREEGCKFIGRSKSVGEVEESTDITEGGAT